MFDEVIVGLLARLRKIGIGARMAESGRVEEKTGRGSLGVILIVNSPIQWVNVRKVEDPRSDSFWARFPEGYPDGPAAYDYYLDYGLSDRRPLPRIELTSSIVKASKRSEQPAAVKWEAWGGGKNAIGVVDSLDNNVDVKDSIVAAHRTVVVESRPDLGFWVFPTRYRDTPGIEMWRCYEIIAVCLLATRLE